MNTARFGFIINKMSLDQYEVTQYLKSFSRIEIIFHEFVLWTLIVTEQKESTKGYIS